MAPVAERRLHWYPSRWDPAAPVLAIASSEMDSDVGRGATSLACVRRGDLVFYEGPQRMQNVIGGFGLPWGHVGIASERNGRKVVVELGYKGVQVRRLASIHRHYKKIGIGRLPVSDAYAVELAVAADEEIVKRYEYGHDLAKLQYYWSNFRCFESDRTAAAARIALPAATALASVCGRGARSTCSSFVHRLLIQLDLDAVLQLRFDRTLPTSRFDRWSYFHRVAGGLCSPNDLWLAPRLDGRIHTWKAKRPRVEEDLSFDRIGVERGDPSHSAVRSLDSAVVVASDNL